jgi:hypothetical protein
VPWRNAILGDCPEVIRSSLNPLADLTDRCQR